MHYVLLQVQIYTFDTNENSTQVEKLGKSQKGGVF